MSGHVIVASSRRRHGWRRGRRGRPTAAALAAALAAAAALPATAPPSAAAHGGFQILAKTSGPYGVVVRARPYLDQGVSKTDVTTYVVRQDIGEPDSTVAVELTLKGPDGTRTLSPALVGDAYETILRADGDAWREWTVTAQIDGAAGTATITGGPVGGAPGAPGWLVPGSVVLVLAVGGGLVLMRRRRRDDDGAGRGDGDQTGDGGDGSGRGGERSGQRPTGEDWAPAGEG